MTENKDLDDPLGEKPLYIDVDGRPVFRQENSYAPVVSIKASQHEVKPVATKSPKRAPIKYKRTKDPSDYSSAMLGVGKYRSNG